MDGNCRFASFPDVILVLW